LHKIYRIKVKEGNSQEVKEEKEVAPDGNFSQEVKEEKEGNSQEGKEERR
jgi:hypothetical protein